MIKQFGPPVLIFLPYLRVCVCTEKWIQNCHFLNHILLFNEMFLKNYVLNKKMYSFF